MDASAVERINEEVSPTVELLNQTCLDLVSQIEILKRENARLKDKTRAEKRAETPSGKDSEETI